ncbi:MAG: hypothetical protein U0136_10130 [Bdellovibrionota bacterium]
MGGPAAATKSENPGLDLSAPVRQAPPAERQPAQLRDASVALPPSAAIQVQLEKEKLERTLGTPRAAAVLEEAKRAERVLEEIQRQSAMLDKESLAKWKPYIASAAAKMNQALAAGDFAGFESQLSTFNKHLERLQKYMSYERTEGLVAVHAESGVRIYSKDGAVWLVTPDAQAFADYRSGAKARELAGFVKGVTGVSLDPNHAVYQASGPARDGQTLLACRMDLLSLQDGRNEFGVRTTLRRDSGALSQDINFTREQVSGGRIVADATRGFGHANGFPSIAFSAPGVQSGPVGNPGSAAAQPQQLAAIPAGANGPAPVPVIPVSRATAAQEHPQPDGRDAGAAIRTATLVTAALGQNGPSPITMTTLAEAAQRVNPLPYLAGRREAALDRVIEETEKRIAKDLKILKKPEEIAEGLKEATAGGERFGRAYATRRAALDAELAKAATPAEKSAVQVRINALEDLRAREVIYRRDLLERQVSSATKQKDVKLARDTKRTLLEMKDDVDRAYQHQIQRATADGKPIDKLEAARGKFASRCTTLADELQTLRGRLTRWAGGGLSWVADHTGLSALSGRVSSALHVDIKVSSLTGWNRFWDWVDKRQAAAVSKTLADTERLLQTGVGTLTADEAASQLALMAKRQQTFQSRLAVLEAQQKGGATGLDTTIQELKDGRARCVLRQREILERQIGEATAAGEDCTALKSKLYGTMKPEVDEAHAQLKMKSKPEATAYNKACKDYAPELERQRVAELVADTKTVRAAADAVVKAEGSLSSAAAGTPAHAEATAEVALAKARLDLAQKDARIAQLEEKLKLNPADADATAEVQRLRVDRARSATAERACGVERASKRVARIDADIADIDAELAKPDQSAKAIAELEKRRGTLLAEQSELRTQTESLADTKKQAGVAVKLADLEQDLAQQRAERAKATDPAAQKTLDQRIAELEGKLRAANIELIRRDLAATEQSLTRLQGELAAVDAELGTLTGQKTARVTELEKSRQRLQGKIKGMEDTKEFLNGQREIYSLESKCAKAGTQLAAKEAALETAKKATTQDPALIAALEGEVQTLRQTSTTLQQELTTARTSFRTTWSARLTAARANFAERVMGRVQGYAQQHPMKAATILAVATESLRGAGMADYDPETRHTVLPSLIFLLNQDFDQWAYTTEQVGVPGAVALEAGSHGGNALIMSGGAYGLYRIGSTAVTSRAGQAVVTRIAGSRLAQSKFVTWAAPKVASYAGPALVGVGAAADGYFTFADGSFVNFNDRQVATATTSPIVAGAVGGGVFFGPPGAIVGAVGGAIGEVAGVTRGLFVLDAEATADYKKRSVRESIELAEQGFVFDAKDPALRSRSPVLSAEEKEVIDGHARVRFLRTIFSRDPNVGLSTEQLKAAGFVTDPGKTPEEHEAAERHNWERSEALFTAGYFSGAPINSLDPELRGRLERERADAHRHYTDLYQTSMRRTYTEFNKTSTPAVAAWDILNTYTFGWTGPGGRGDQGGVAISSEFHDRLAVVAKEFAEKFGTRDSAAVGEDRAALAEEQWGFLASRFPQIGLIFSDTEARRLFVNGFSMLAGEKGKQLEDYALMSDIDRCATGVAILRNSRDDFAVQVQHRLARGLTDDLADGAVLDQLLGTN